MLEDWRTEHKPWMEGMSEKLDKINTNLLALRLCASPNMCQAIDKEVKVLVAALEAQEARIESLEKWRTFISGAVAALTAIWFILQVVLPWGLKLVVGT